MTTMRELSKLNENSVCADCDTKGMCSIHAHTHTTHTYTHTQTLLCHSHILTETPIYSFSYPFRVSFAVWSFNDYRPRLGVHQFGHIYMHQVCRCASKPRCTLLQGAFHRSRHQLLGYATNKRTNESGSVCVCVCVCVWERCYSDTVCVVYMCLAFVKVMCDGLCVCE